MKKNKLLLILLSFVYLIILLRTAWIGDDAFITLRTVDNWNNGYGLTWNPAERVQTYTHPLWMFLLTGFYYLIGNAYFSTVGLSLLVSLSVMVILLHQQIKNETSLILTWLLAILSNAFIDYSTSGLENPLSHLLMLLFCILFFKKNVESEKDIFLLGLIAGLSAFNRLDTVLIYLPALGLIVYRRFNFKTIIALIVGFIPLILWLFFSLFYYGFIFPNTYYAKLSTGIPKFTLIHQGVIYYLNSISLDPLTLIIIFSTFILILTNDDLYEKIIGLGLLLYLGYIINIGGDFMSGRFFSVPFVASILILGRHFINLEGKYPILISLGAISFALMAPNPSFAAPQTFDLDLAGRSGISDEQGFYYGSSGLMRWGRYSKLPDHPWVDEGVALRKENVTVYIGKGIGYLGFYAGPKVHIVDSLALADPLLSRLPVPKSYKWDIGHFYRPLPPGYLETLETGENKIIDPNLSLYYEKLTLIVRGNLWSSERLLTILEFNLGAYDHLLDEYIALNSE